MGSMCLLEQIDFGQGCMQVPRKELPSSATFIWGHIGIQNTALLQ